MPYIPYLLRFLNVPNSFDLDMATYRRPMEDCLDLTLCADFLQIPEPSPQNLFGLLRDFCFGIPNVESARYL